MSNEHKAIFKAYLRNLMTQLEAMEKESENNNIENAKKFSAI